MPKRPNPPDTQIHSLPSRRASYAAQAPSPHQISRRAYELFLKRGGDHGHDMDDWLQAETELGRPAQRDSANRKSR